jgi:integrase
MAKRIPTGSVFQRKYRDAHGAQRTTATWFIRYCIKGQPVCEPAKTTDREEALRILRERIAKAARNTNYSEQIDKVIVNQLLDLVIEDYQANSLRSSYDTELRINKHLRPFFGHKLAITVGTTAIKDFTAKRAAVAAPATVNKELAFLRRAFRLGTEQEPPLASRIPHMRMLKGGAIRKGIVSYEQYRAIRDILPSYARIALVIGYFTGTRRGEILQIRIDRIDFKAGRIDIPGDTAKNKEDRFLPIYGDMAAELSMAISLADAKCPFLVQDKGKRVARFYKSWTTACETAGVPDALFHDLRRTAATNMIEAGWSEKEAMEITGHRTRSMFDRYHIVSARRIKMLADRLALDMQAREKASLVPADCTSGKNNVQ